MPDTPDGAPTHEALDGAPTHEALLALVGELAAELHPRRARRMRVTLDSSLDRDLGFDSLSRVELLLRLQRRFHSALPEDLLASAETPRDLFDALHASGGQRAERVEVATRSPLEEISSTPETATTLPEMLDWHVARTPSRPHVYLYGDHPEPEVVDYEHLASGARALAAGLQRAGIGAGQSVAIMLPTSLEYLHTFFGILMAGAVPVPIYPPLRPSQIEDHLRRHAGILANAGTAMLVTSESARRVAQLLKAHVPNMGGVATPAELAASDHAFEAVPIAADDTAFLQYTSGSTGQPKGVILSHANLLANIRAMGVAVSASSKDVFVSWLPLYHDMGLIGAWLASLYFGMPLVLMSPLKFLTYPPRWLWAIHDHRATLTAAPNFAFELCLSKIEDRDVEGLDLSSIRMAFNGAEPVSPNTIRRFTERFAEYGFAPNAIAPVYGLAEAAVGLAFPPADRGPAIDRIDKKQFELQGQALTARDDAEHVLEFVACGQPLPGYEIRIADETGRELPDGIEGRLEFQGPSATRGYMNNPEATSRLFDGEWLDSGDLAYIRNGDVYLTRRVKDIIIRGGRNIYPYEVEEAVGELPAIRKGCVAVFGSPDPETGTERVVVVAETRETASATLEPLYAEVTAIATDILDMPPDEVVLAPPHSVLKTSSGKIRRAAVRELFETGRIGERPKAIWWQIVRLAMTSWTPQVRNALRRVVAIAYGGYVYLILGFLGVPVWILVATLPRVSWRCRVAQTGCRWLARLAGVRVEIEGATLPSDGRAIVVANHASYADGLLLTAALPPSTAFVAKGELNRQFVPGTFLRGVGTEFVERWDAEQGVTDTDHMLTSVQSGKSLVFFPEGTFTRAPGLLPFHMGAFVIAARAQLPVVPVTLIGSRSLLRADSWLPRRTGIRIVVGHAIAPSGTDWSAAIDLRNAARETILAELDEPDLGDAESPLLQTPRPE
jgi:1-acyl-sn-glycerol-3-phosphate acyltransferase